MKYCSFSYTQSHTHTLRRRGDGGYVVNEPKIQFMIRQQSNKTTRDNINNNNDNNDNNNNDNDNNDDNLKMPAYSSEEWKPWSAGTTR